MPTQALLKQDQVPTWVKPVDTKSIFQQYLSDNSYIHQIINDSQIGYFEDDFINYISVGRNLADIEDVEYYSNLTFTFDPEYEEILIHEIKVFRDGKWFDKLNDAKVDILQREEELNKLVYDGQHTLSLILYDVRVGDLLNYSYSRKGRNPVFKSYFGRQEYINSRAEIYHSHILAAFDEKNHQNLDIRYFNENEKLTKEQLENYTLYELTSHKLKAVKVPDDAPKWYDPWNRIIFSNTKTWEEVNNWAREIYTGIYDTQTHLDQLIEECKEHSQDKRKQITYALFYVQEQIRYFADGSNLGGITPLDPNKSLEMRFADCKNKVVILKSILDKLGVECYPALVHSDDGELLLEQGARVSAFNHMIIQIIHEEKTYWFDATFTGQKGDIEHISQTDHAYALVLKEGETTLQSMKPDIEKGAIHVQQFYDLRTEENTLRIITTYTDFHADRMRKRAKGRKIHELQDNYVSYYQKKYPKLQSTESILVKDNPSLNTLSLTESYTLGNIWEYMDEDQSFQTYFECDDLRNAFGVPDKGQRTAPFSMTYPSKITEEREILLPFPYEDELTNKKEDNPFFTFEKQESLNDKKTILTQKYHYLSKTNLIKVENIPAYIKSTSNIYTSYRIWNDDPYDESGQRKAASLPYNKQTIFIHVKQFYDLVNEDACKLTINTTYYGHEAYIMRKRLSTEGVEELTKNFLEYYERFYEGVESKETLKIDDYPQENKLCVEENYLLTKAWIHDEESNAYTVTFVNDTVGSAHTIIDKNSKEESIKLNYPSYVKEERSVIYPFPFEDSISNSSVENDFYAFEEKENIDKKSNVFTQTYLYQVKEKKINKSDFPSYTKDQDQVYVNYTKSHKNPYNKHVKSGILASSVYTLIAGYIVIQILAFFSE